LYESRRGAHCWRLSGVGKGYVIGGAVAVAFEEMDEVEEDDAKLLWKGGGM
jgi:hypothetical protein